jgi:hypothetical protein
LAKAKKKAAESAQGGPFGPFTLFPGKVKRNIRLTDEAFSVLETAGKILKHPTGRAVGWAEIVEGLALVYGARISYADLERAVHVRKRLQRR